MSVMNEDTGGMPIEEMYQRIVTDPELIPRCSEHDFRMTWLPLFSGQILVEDSATGTKRAPMAEWTRVSGSHHNPVRVVDENGKVVFVVPPLVRKVDMKEDKDGVALSVVIQHTSQLRNANKVGQANKFMYEYFRHNVAIQYQIREELETWNTIFGRYPETKHLVVDIDELLGTKPSAKEGESSSGSGVGLDDFEF